MLKLQFHVAQNETLISDLSKSLGVERSTLQKYIPFHLWGKHDPLLFCRKVRIAVAHKTFSTCLCRAESVLSIDMNNRFPLYRSDLKNRFRLKKEEECYVPSLEEYVAPFVKTGFEIIRSEHFCWIPHSAGRVLLGVMDRLSPLLNMVAKTRAMRSLVVARKPQ